LFTRKNNGFTLIELLVVVAIIGLLAAIAVPKYMDSLERANLAATLGNLSTLRTTITVYYSTYLAYPDSIDLSTESKLKENLMEIPYVKSKYPFGNDSPYGNSVTVSSIANVIPETKGKGWFYNKPDGKIYINSIASDIKGNVYYTY
jgi:prepilin-type N-terminal cleavage/methylation domain-containing protein